MMLLNTFNRSQYRENSSEQIWHWNHELFLKIAGFNLGATQEFVFNIAGQKSSYDSNY